METMTTHKWFDDDIESVRMDTQATREIGIKKGNEGALLIDESDVVALAKEFGLVVYRKDARL